MRKTIFTILGLMLGCSSDFNPDLGDLDETDSSATGGATDGDTSDQETGTGADGTDDGDDGTHGTDASSSGDPGTDDTGTDDGTEAPTTNDGGTTGTGTGLEEPGPGDQCHPMNGQMEDVPACPDLFTCEYQGWDMDEEYWDWTCELSGGDGGWLDTCVYDTNSCAPGFWCTGSIFIDGDCPDSHCCTPYCDPLNDACPQGYECMALAEETSMFPPFFKDTDIPLVGYCRKP